MTRTSFPRTVPHSRGTRLGAVVRTVARALAPVILAACSALTSAPSGDFVARDGLELSGVVDVETFLVPAGCTVYVEHDLLLNAQGPVRIAGRLVARDADGANGLDAPNIEIRSPIVVDIPGDVLGGRGASPKPKMREGGHGSNVTVRAPIAYVDGVLMGGPGGEGGPGRRGGSGGDVLVEGYMLVRRSSVSHASVIGGKGGMGGSPGGAGGSGGTALCEVPERVRVAIDTLQPRAEEALRAGGAEPLR